MWNEKLEQQAARMREKNARLAELLRIREEKYRKKELKALGFETEGQKYLLDRISPEERQKGLEKSWAGARERGDKHRKTIVEIHTGTSQKGRTIRDPSKRTGYPACPHCSNSRPEGTIRAGMSRGIQRYRCLQCRATYSGPTVTVRLEKQDYSMICYHCGSSKTERLGRSTNESRTGRVGRCLACSKTFIQGGLKDLQKYHLLLEKRVIDLGLPNDVEAEVLQTAYTDVLTGKGYCWTVELKTKEAWRNCRGEWGQRGSDDPAFREQQGQKKYID